MRRHARTTGVNPSLLLCTRWPSAPMMRGCDGPQMSTSTTPTCRHDARRPGPGSYLQGWVAGQAERQLRRHRALAHTTLARHDQDLVLDGAHPRLHLRNVCAA